MNCTIAAVALGDTCMHLCVCTVFLTSNKQSTTKDARDDGFYSKFTAPV